MQHGNLHSNLFYTVVNCGFQALVIFHVGPCPCQMSKRNVNQHESIVLQFFHHSTEAISLYLTPKCLPEKNAGSKTLVVGAFQINPTPHIVVGSVPTLFPKIYYLKVVMVKFHNI